ncbi:hypothetical protein BJ546DRAFT_837614, partial [Cryomyces antarcticus]
FSVSLRCWVRGSMIRSFGWDDFTMLLTLYVIADMALYVASTVILKISLGIYFLRIAIKKWQIYTIYSLMTISTLYGIIYFLVAIFQCGLPSLFLQHQLHKQCINPQTLLGLGYTHAVISTITDWTFAILPIFVLWNTNMDIRSKVSVAIILTLGAIGSIATIIRAKYIYGIVYFDQDFFYNATNIGMWSTIEPGIGITAGSLATLRPLFKCCLQHARNSRLSSSSRDRKKQVSARPRINPVERSGFESFDYDVESRVITTVVGGSENHDRDSCPKHGYFSDEEDQNDSSTSTSPIPTNSTRKASQRGQSDGHRRRMS